MKKAFVILVVSLSVSSCTFSQMSLKRENYLIPDSLFSFFPDKSDKYRYLKIKTIFENAKKTETSLPLLEFDVVKLIELYQCNNKDFLQQLINEYRLQSIFSIKSESKDYFVIGSGWDLSQKYDTLQLKERYAKLKDKSMVLYFEPFEETPSLYDATTISGLPVGYEILVLKSGNDFVLPQDDLLEWSVLPENLKHGYRSGVAFKEDEPYIIYWVVAW